MKGRAPLRRWLAEAHRQFQWLVGLLEQDQKLIRNIEQWQKRCRNFSKLPPQNSFIVSNYSSLGVDLSWKIRYRIVHQHFSKFHRISPICKGYISALSKPMFATKYSLFSIFRDLLDSHSFAPLQIQNLQIIFRGEDKGNLKKTREKH